MSHPGEPPASHPSPPTEPNLFADNSKADKPDFMVWPTIPDSPRTPRRRRRGTRVLVGALITVVALAAVSTGTFVLYQRHLDKNIDRIGNPFQALPEKARPKPAPPGATNILMLGSDRRISAAPGEWVDAGQHTDSIMIGHVPADRARVTLTSIPRDSWVTVPGHGRT